MFATIDRCQRPAPVVMLLRTGLYRFAGLRLLGAGGLKGCVSPPLVLWLGFASLSELWRPLDPTRRGFGPFAAPVVATAVRRSALERPASHSRRDAVVEQFLSLADALARRFQQRFARLIEFDDARQGAESRWL
jgi:hypothetical protein